MNRLGILGSLVAAAVFTFVASIAAGTVKISNELIPWILSGTALSAASMIFLEYRSRVQSGVPANSSDGAPVSPHSPSHSRGGTVLVGRRRRNLLFGAFSSVSGALCAVLALINPGGVSVSTRNYLLVGTALMLAWGLADLIGKSRIRLEFTDLHLALVQGRRRMSIPWPEIERTRVVHGRFTGRLIVYIKSGSILRTTEPTMSAIDRYGAIYIDLEGTKINTRTVEEAIRRWRP